ncbi:MAG: hypothetical protein LBL66_09290 [Clostridiales bacterium]|jgi:hypothetical protein|nr:hypothetical protein [Clostridiales bacterium]
MKVIDGLFEALGIESQRLIRESDIETKIAIAYKIGGIVETLKKAVEASRLVVGNKDDWMWESQTEWI